MIIKPIPTRRRLRMPIPMMDLCARAFNALYVVAWGAGVVLVAVWCAS